MAGRAERLYSQLQTAEAVLALIGQPEDAHFDCKEWPTREDDALKMLAKAACGLTNADGGVLVIGMKAESRPKDEPDVVTAAVPVAETSYVKSKVFNLIGDLVEPGIVGLEAVEIPDSPAARSGFVVVFIPQSEGAPRRSRKDWKFYQRIGSSTLPMEFWQIEAMFGVTPRPKLTLHIESAPMRTSQGFIKNPLQQITFGLKNEGRGLAKFPGVRFKQIPLIKRDDFGLDGNGGFGIPPRASEPGWLAYRGGVDDVIYPGELRLIGKLCHLAVRDEEGWTSVKDVLMKQTGRPSETRWVCNPLALEYEISSEGAQTHRGDVTLPENEIVIG